MDTQKIQESENKMSSKWKNNKIHPEIDFYCFGDKQLNELFSIHPNVNWNTVHPFVTYQLIDDYDMVVHFDADSMVVGKLDELLNESNF